MRNKKKKEKEKNALNAAAISQYQIRRNRIQRIKEGVPRFNCGRKFCEARREISTLPGVYQLPPSLPKQSLVSQRGSSN